MALSTTRPAPPPGRPIRPRGPVRIVRAGALGALLAVLLVVTPTAPAWSQVVGAQQPTASSTPGVEADAPSPAAGATTAPAGGAAAAANTPQPTGQPLPSKRQRVADSLVAVFLLVVLVGGVAIAWFRTRRSHTGEST